MRYLKYLLGGMLTAALVACGGGGGSAGTTPGGGGGSGNTGSSVTSIELLASATSLASADNTTGVTITAVVKNAANNGVAAQAVAFAASSGVLGSVAATSDTNGKATAVLTTGSDRSSRDVTVTVTSGSISKTIVIPVTGTALTITGSASMLVGSASAFAVSLKDSNGNAIAGASLTATSALGNAITPATVTTLTDGSASISYTATNAGNDTLTVSGGGTSVQYAVSVSNTNFVFVTPADGSSVAIGATQTVTVQLLPAVAGTAINFSSTRGLVNTPTATTNASGIASTTVSSTTAGAATVTAQAPNGAQTRRAVNFVATVPSSLVLQTNTSAVAPNSAGSSANSVTLTATVRDVNNNAVQGATVNFSLAADTSGGRIGTGTGVTNANGVVTDTFVPGISSTAANGVQIVATVASTLISGTATVTVSNRALFITIGTSNTIANLDQNTYSKPFSVYVSDSNGAAVANQSIVLSVYALGYGKGQLTFSNGSWRAIDTVATPITSCVNEDENRDGILQASEDDSRNVGASVINTVGNGNGDGRLTPGAPGLVSPSVVTTDASGLATFNLNYGEQYAPWVYFEVKARAAVSGTESSAIYYFSAGGAASDFTDSAVAPAGRVSPFGTAASCNNPN